jgi:hypothetical protein
LLLDRFGGRGFCAALWYNCLIQRRIRGMFDFPKVLSMDDPVLAKTICLDCHAELDAGDNYCRHCGAPIGRSGNAGTTAPIDARATLSPVPCNCWDRPWVVLTLLFVVLGPFAIPLLWRSRRFSLVWKNVLTVFVLAETVLLLWVFWLILQYLYAPLFRDLKELLQH